MIYGRRQSCHKYICDALESSATPHTHQGLHPLLHHSSYAIIRGLLFPQSQDVSIYCGLRLSPPPCDVDLFSKQLPSNLQSDSIIPNTEHQKREPVTTFRSETRSVKMSGLLGNNNKNQQGSGIVDGATGVAKTGTGSKYHQKPASLIPPTRYTVSPEP